MNVGIDLGGTKIEIVVLDAGAERFRKRVATPAGDYRGTIAAIKGLVDDAERAVGVRGVPVGIATPGAISPATGLMKNSNSVCLNGMPLDRDIEVALGRAVRLANDANCFALSEAVDGAAAGAEVVFGVIVGTGTGGGVVVRGHVLTGPNAIAGEWGHNPLPWPQAAELPGPACYCGKHGCIETFLSGPGLARDYFEATGEKLVAEKIAATAAKNSADAQVTAARATLARYADRMARAVASVINVLDPDVIVLGGGVSNIAQLYELVPPLIQKYAFSDRISTKLVRARHGDSSGVRGAAWLWPAK